MKDSSLSTYLTVNILRGQYMNNGQHKAGGDEIGEYDALILL